MGFIGKALGAITGTNAQAKAAKKAAGVQAGAAQAGIDNTKADLAASRAYQAMLFSQADDGAAADRGNTAAYREGEYADARLRIAGGTAEAQGYQAPYVDAGRKGLDNYLDLLGLNGAGDQTMALDAVKSSPLLALLNQQGEDAILANAGATGGLRGGNTQDALAKLRSANFGSIYQQLLGGAGSLASMGQTAAGNAGNIAVDGAGRLAQIDLGAANAATQDAQFYGNMFNNNRQFYAGLYANGGVNAAQSIANLLNQQGSATAGGIIAKGSAAANGLNSGLNLIGTGVGIASGIGALGGGGGLWSGSGAFPSAAYGW